jgi:hypothetical protein
VKRSKRRSGRLVLAHGHVGCHEAVRTDDPIVAGVPRQRSTSRQRPREVAGAAPRSQATRRSVRASQSPREFRVNGPRRGSGRAIPAQHPSLRASPRSVPTSRSRPAFHVKRSKRLSGRAWSPAPRLVASQPAVGPSEPFGAGVPRERPGDAAGACWLAHGHVGCHEAVGTDDPNVGSVSRSDAVAARGGRRRTVRRTSTRRRPSAPPLGRFT